MIKFIINLPCPSCGTTRSIIALLKGEFIQAFKLNPFGYAVTGIIFIIPVWIVSDVIKKRATFFSFYRRIEDVIQKPGGLISIALVVIINWIWNVFKGV